MPSEVDPGDVCAEKAARRLGLTLTQFEEIQPRLYARGFPRPYVDTGHFDLDAIDSWRKTRNPHLFGLTAVQTARDPSIGFRDRLEALRGSGKSRR
jgi:hypothetical protein